MEKIRTRRISELPLEQLKGLHLPAQVVTLAQIDAGPGPEGQTANRARFTFCCPPLLRTV
jgi:hypothetical protein